MSRSKRRLAVVALVGLAAATVTAVGSSSPAGGQAPEGIEVLDNTGPFEPVAGFSGHDPVPGAETAPEPATNDGIEGSAPLTESVIGADGRVQVTNTTGNINRRIGQIELTQTGIGSFICTGWLIDDNSILTSGHCAFDPTGGGGLIEAATWYPGRNGASDPFGGCPVTFAAFPTNWQNQAKPAADYAVLNFANPGPCDDIGQTLGTFGMMAFANVDGLDNKNATVQGYPGDMPDGTMWKMNGRIDRRSTAAMLFYPMDTFGGQSGSPIWWNRLTGACTGACGYGVHSYGVGISGLNRNSGPRLSAARIGQIQGWAGMNGG
jgi:glutamyl endopeptidase